MKIAIYILMTFLMLGSLKASTIVLTSQSETSGISNHIFDKPTLHFSKKDVSTPKMTFLMKLFSSKKKGFSLTFTDSLLLYSRSLLSKDNVTKSAFYAKLNYRF